MLVLSPAPHRAGIDVDHGRDERPIPAAEDHSLPHVRAELELVLHELRAELCAVVQGHDILDPVNDYELPILVKVDGVSGVHPSILTGLLRVLRDLHLSLRNRNTHAYPVASQGSET